MADEKNFGTAENFSGNNFVANYKGPLTPLKFHDPTTLELVATHQDENATLELFGSAQRIMFDTSVVPNKVSGEASFFTRDGQHILFCNFAGIAPLKKAGDDFQMAYVHVLFTGGTGKFANASGTGSVEAELYPDRGFSQGKIIANVILPK